MSCQMLALDISTKSTGYAVFENGVLKHHGVINYDEKDSQQRLHMMTYLIYHFFDWNNIAIVVVEQPIFNQNVKTFSELSMMVGAVYAFCIENHNDFHMFLPSQWRALISSEKKPRKRKELKEWGKQKARELYGVEVRTDDESDAILIGTAYGNLFKEK